MSVRHHDHPGAPGGIDPADLDLYALHALPEQDADIVEQAIVGAPAGQRESILAHIASTREVAAGLVADAGLDTAPPPHLRATILRTAAQTPASGRGSAREPAGTGAQIRAGHRAGGASGDESDSEDASPGGAAVVDLSRARENRRPRMWTVVSAAAAAIVLVAAGVTIGRITDGVAPEDNLPVAGPANGSMPGDVTSLLASEDLEIARGQVGTTGLATVLASRSADMAVISMTGIPEPVEGRAYQLWLMGDHDPISAGTMEAGQVGPAPSAQIDGIRGSEQIGITEEPAGGSPAPTGEVLLAIDLD